MANKLYTEEQVRKAYQSGFGLAMETDGGLKEGQEEFINSLTPIELPSDEEIEEALFHQSNEYAYGFIDAFNWLKDKILKNGK